MCEKNEENSIYLGDGAYATFITGYSIIIYTSDGIEEKNHIHLEKTELRKLNEFAERVGLASKQDLKREHRIQNLHYELDKEVTKNKQAQGRIEELEAVINKDPALFALSNNYFYVKNLKKEFAELKERISKIHLLATDSIIDDLPVYHQKIIVDIQELSQKNEERSVSNE